MNLLLPLRIRLANLFEKRSKVATENYVRAVVEIGREEGYDLGGRDRCFVHPNDIPASVKLAPGMPVIESTAPAMVPGRLFFVKGHRLPGALTRAAVVAVPAAKGVH